MDNRNNSRRASHSLEFNSQEAWEKLNEGFLRLETSLFAKGATKQWSKLWYITYL